MLRNLEEIAGKVLLYKYNAYIISCPLEQSIITSGRTFCFKDYVTIEHRLSLT
jgi:hypothetical protein